MYYVKLSGFTFCLGDCFILIAHNRQAILALSVWETVPWYYVVLIHCGYVVDGNMVGSKVESTARKNTVGNTVGNTAGSTARRNTTPGRTCYNM